MKPITPQEVANRLREFPDYVIAAFNKLIFGKWDGNTARISQDEAINEIICCANNMDIVIERQTIFNKGWLDVEPNFRKFGWSVEFDKPGYNENYKAYWIFKKAS